LDLFNDETFASYFENERPNKSRECARIKNHARTKTTISRQPKIFHFRTFTQLLKLS